MSQHAVALHNYNNELVKCMEEMTERKSEINRQIQLEEQQKAKLLNEVQALNDQIKKIEQDIAFKVQAIGGYDKTLQEAEHAYMKILESSQTLLSVVKKESMQLTDRVYASQPTNIPINMRQGNFGGMGEGRHGLGSM